MLINLFLGQLEIFNPALQMLAEAESETSKYVVSKNTILSLDRDLAAQILILVHPGYQDWLKAETTSIRGLEGIRGRVMQGKVLNIRI